MEPHSHVFLGKGHEQAETRTWWVIGLCGAMMAIEIVGGLLSGSIALVADGLHMSTHAGALLLAALAYRYARRHATDARFTFGTGKLGDLAGFTSAIVLAMIALLIGWEAVGRILDPVPIAFRDALVIAGLGLAVNVASAWMLGGGHRHGHNHEAAVHAVELDGRIVELEIHEDGVPPRFRIRCDLPASDLTAETVRPDGMRQRFGFRAISGALESIDAIPEPHDFTVHLRRGAATASVRFTEHTHAHGAAHHDHNMRDNNMRAAVIHVLADAAVSVLVIVGLLLARIFGWLWMDPLAGLIGAAVIASWTYSLVRDTGRILLDMNPDPRLTERLRQAIETDGDHLTDLHLWRLGPGHLGAVLSVVTGQDRRPEYYRQRLRQFPALSHITVEVQSP
jgi:cation diffusion facilitator family transporter